MTSPGQDSLVQPGAHCPHPPAGRRWRRRLVKFAGIAGLVAVVIVLATVEGLDHEPYFQTGYHRLTRAYFQSRTATNQAVFGELQAGFGRARLTPALDANGPDRPAEGRFHSVPLAGYGSRRGRPAEGVHDDLWVKAVALRVGGKLGVMIAADALIVPPEVCQAAMANLRQKHGLARDQVYLGATHSHSSIGGWGEGKVAEGFAGPFNPGIREWFAGRIVEAVEQAINDLKPASVGSADFDAPDLVRNRLVGDHGKTDPEFSLLLLKQDQGKIGVIGSFAAHATVLSSRTMQFSGDYPGQWQRALEETTGGMALFFGGGMGSHSPVPGGDGFEGAEKMGRELARRTTERLQRITVTNVLEFAITGLEVVLPEPHVRLTDNTRLRPWLARKMLPVGDRTFFQVFRLGETLWISTPCDFSGELALGIKDMLRAKGRQAVVTSFNGDYIGYVIPSRYYYLGGYEAQIMSFFGPTIPDYFDEWMRALALASLR